MGSGAAAETVLLGHLVDESGTGLGNVKVALEWRETRCEGHEFDETNEVRTGADGRFVACTIPADTLITVSLLFEDVPVQGVIMTRPAFGFEVTAPPADIVYRRMMIPGVG